MKHSTRDKRAHHMWEAEKENGKLRIKRTKHADEEELFAEKQARRTARKASYPSSQMDSITTYYYNQFNLEEEILAWLEENQSLLQTRNLQDVFDSIINDLDLYDTPEVLDMLQQVFDAFQSGEQHVEARKKKGVRKTRSTGRNTAMMTKVDQEDYAIQMAEEQGAFYGMSVFDGKWYIGTEEEVKNVGVVEPKSPSGSDVVAGSKRARLKASQEEAAMACLGVWAATLVDDELLTREIAQPIVARFNAVRPEDAPRVHTWAQIGKVITGQKLAAVKRAVSDGMRTRLVSKSLNVPFLVAAELIDKMDGMDMKVMKAAVASVKQGNRVAAKKYGSIARDIQSAFARFGGMRLAVDDKAKKYFEDYFGPYGVELVADIQRRVRADLAYKWLTKHGVDAAAAEYWSSYFSENGYGAQLVGDVAKRLSPANSKSEEGVD